MNPPALIILNLQLCKPFLLVDQLVLHLVLLLQLRVDIALLLLILLLDHLGLFGLLLFREVDGLLNFALLLLPLFGYHVVLLGRELG